MPVNCQALTLCDCKKTLTTFNGSNNVIYHYPNTIHAEMHFLQSLARANLMGNGLELLLPQMISVSPFALVEIHDGGYKVSYCERTAKEAAVNYGTKDRE